MESPPITSEEPPEERMLRSIYVIRGQRVMLDRDLAALYGVKPIALRQQLKRNRARLPKDFVFQLNTREIQTLLSQNVIPSEQSLGGSIQNLSHSPSRE